MKKGLMIGIIVVIALVIIVGAILIFNKPKNNIVPNPTPNAETITIQNLAFTPSTITIKVGDTITWTNKDSMAHTVTSDSGTELNSNTLSTGQTYSHTFNTVGTYNYHCSIHLSMKATVIVA